MKCKYIDKLSVLFRIKSCVDLKRTIFYNFSATFIWSSWNSRCITNCPNSLLSEVRISVVCLWANGKEVIWFCPHSKQWNRRLRNLGEFLLWCPEFCEKHVMLSLDFCNSHTFFFFYARFFLLLDICMSYPSFDWGWRPLSLGAN